MKQIISSLVILLMIINYSNAQIELKGIELGSYNQPDRIVTTVAGINGAVYSFKLNDGKCYQIGFANVNRNEAWASSQNMQIFYDGVESNYGIKFVKKNDNGSWLPYEGIFIAQKGNVVFRLESRFKISTTFFFTSIMRI